MLNAMELERRALRRGYSRARTQDQEVNTSSDRGLGGLGRREGEKGVNA